MSNLSPALLSDSDVEITLTGGLVVESRVTRHEAHQVPEEVAVAGPLAVAQYLNFLDRAGITAVSPTMEHIEVTSCDLAA